VSRRDRQGALTAGGRRLVWIEQQFHMPLQAEAPQTRIGQKGRVHLALRHLAQPRLHIAAQHADLERGPQGQKLRLPPEAGGADPGVLGQVEQGPHVGGADQGVAGVFPRGRAAEDDLIRQRRRQVLHGMDGQVDAAVQHRLVQLLGEQALAARLLQAAVLDAVAGGDDGDDLERAIGVGDGKCVADKAGLRQGQGGAARADADGGG
jgi:hypothetical protein